MKSISVIIPLYNEKGSLAELHQELTVELAKLDLVAEIIYVDDGSRDGSLALLKALQSRDPRIRIIRFRRNFGKSAALSAGFEASSGDVILTLDADLQDQPAEMHKLLGRLREGSDLVSGWKKKRFDPLSKRIPSKVFNRVTSLLTGVPLHDMNCGFKAYRREVVESIKVYGEMHRYIPVLASYKGFVVSEVVVEHRKRLHGRSKFGAARFFGGFFDLLTVIMLTRYNRKPLHVFGIVGLLLFGLGLSIETYLTLGWFRGIWIGDRPAFMLGILLLIVGMQFIFFGLLAEMIAYSAKQEDDFSIGEILESSESLEKQVGVQPVSRVGN
ncbi:MAG: glycosyltransferase family 2 protein [Acidobacteriota bacterium]|nr:MAG: glycosyltransferase family 2 protein [Acidobacteriota bacterium]